MSDVVIVAYRPKAGKQEALLQLIREHVPMLRAYGLATEMPSTLAMAADGTVVEVFEWATGAMEQAHTHPAVGAMWASYAEVCDYVPLRSLAEAGELFAAFQRLELTG